MGFVYQTVEALTTVLQAHTHAHTHTGENAKKNKVKCYMKKLLGCLGGSVN